MRDQISGKNELRGMCDPKTTDRYRRIVAVCWPGSVDLNAWILAQGWAIAYRYFSKQYVPQEDEARKARRGIWAGSFEEPCQWRKSQRR
jgi:endonuclease YncB( thermonuclease family)